jgi:hypothetical protein
MLNSCKYYSFLSPQLHEFKSFAAQVNLPNRFAHGSGAPITKSAASRKRTTKENFITIPFSV